ncbi:MAG: hypothetical protein HZC28_01705 [Spirochaetes bacterium]|nr:hypothetical protein [Spirochaetota bacterium]
MCYRSVLCTLICALLPLGAADIQSAINNAAPGSTVLIPEGVYDDLKLSISVSGRADAPITIQASVPGGAVFSGVSSIEIKGSYIILEGLYFTNGGLAAKRSPLTVRGSYCRVTSCAVADYNSGSAGKWITLTAGSVSNRVDHCYFRNKKTEDPTMQIEVAADTPNYHRIDHNYFAHRPPLGKNGGETIRIGFSSQATFNSHTVVGENLFEECDGEIEVISSKSCENVYLHNTFRNCDGALTFRHGERCAAYGNFFIADGKKSSHGIRIINAGHLVMNNYFESIRDGAICFTAGQPDAPATGYGAVRDVFVAYNTFVNCRGGVFMLHDGLGDNGRTILPSAVVAYNRIDAETAAVIGTNESIRFTGNVISGNAAVSSIRDGITQTVQKLQRSDAIMRPEIAFPGGEPVWTSSMHAGIDGLDLQCAYDIDGQKRDGHRDIGCDQISADPILHRPLTAKDDVGPPWMKR